MKNLKFTKKLTALLVAFAMFVPMMASSVVAGAQWTPDATTNIFIVATAAAQAEYSKLEQYAKLFYSEINAVGNSGVAQGIAYGPDDQAGENDIVLNLDPEAYASLEEQGFNIKVGNDGITVNAKDLQGIFNGFRYVTKAYKLGSGLAVNSEITDAPETKERAFFLDCGRKYYSPECIKDLIEEISWAGMNALYLHFSEDMGLRLESKTYPWLAGSDSTLCIAGTINDPDEGKYIKQDEMAEIVKYAQSYNVEIIPSFDSPGHMNYAVKKYNEKFYPNSDYVSTFGIANYLKSGSSVLVVQGSGTEAAQKKYSRGINLANEEARTFAKNLYSEYGKFFYDLGCTKFDIGGDELLGWGASISGAPSGKWNQLDHWEEYAEKQTGKSAAVAYDAFILYMNEIYELMNGLGYKSVRMWNDDAYRTDAGNYISALDKNIEILYWSPGTNSAQYYINKGHNVYNFLNYHNYYVLKSDVSYEGCNENSIYNYYSAYKLTASLSASTDVTGESQKNVKGTAFCVWCDDPSYQTANEVMESVKPLLRVQAAKAWSADHTYPDGSGNEVSLTLSEYKARWTSDYPSALAEAPEVTRSVDVTALSEELDAYNAIISQNTPYAAESLKAYELAANKANAVVSSVYSTKEDVDAATEALKYERKNLRYASKISDAIVLSSLAARGTSCAKGLAIVVAISATADVNAIEVFYENGARAMVVLSHTQKTEDGALISLMVQIDEIGKHTLSFYGLTADGGRSEAALTLDIVCS